VRPLRQLPIAAIDFEATDFPGPDTYVCDVAVVHAELGSDAPPRLAFTSLVRPPISIPERVAQIHGIRDADVADAPTFGEVADRMLAAIGDRIVVAFNAPADFRFAEVELARLGRSPIPWPWIDLFVVRKATKTRGRPGRLGEIAREHGIDLDAHGAAGDALTTALLLTPMMRAAWSAGAFASSAGAQPKPRYSDDWRGDDEDGDDEEAPRIETLEAFFAWQRGAALYQERDFADYCKRKGDASPPRCDWHAIENVEAPWWPAPARAGACPTCGGAVLIRVAQDGTRGLFAITGGTPHVCAP
jgi:DNA polymerase III epsilon subunit-like protein